MNQDLLSSTHTRIDLVGSFASMLCALHCASAVFIPTALGALGLGALIGHEAEWVFTLVGIGFAATAALVGWRHHRSTLVVSLLALGIAGLLASRAIETSASHEHGHHEATMATMEQPRHAHHGPHEDIRLLGTLVGILAGGLLVSGHLAGIRARRSQAA
jgi:hypothetical protein